MPCSFCGHISKQKSMAMSVRCVDMLCHVFAILMLLRRLLHDRGSGAMAKRGSCVIAEPVDPLWEEYVMDPGFLGRGSNGRVLRGYLKSTMTLRALKCVDGDFAQEEADILKSLAHSNIIPLLKFFPPESPRKDGVLVFPEREGDLGHFIARRRADLAVGAEGLGVIAGPMQLPSRVPRWARQVAGAVAYLHSRSIVHRDLKPGNILLRWNADGGFDLEVADLGSAKMMVPGRPVRLRDKASVDGHRRNVATVMEAMTPHCCTFPYAAPEMWFGGWEEATSVYGYSLDVWSYGAVIFEVITLGPFAPGKCDAKRVAAVLRRLGPFPKGHVLGPRQGGCMRAAKDQDASHVPALLDMGPTGPGSAIGHIEQALRWLPRARLTASALLEDSWVAAPFASSQGQQPADPTRPMGSEAPSTPPKVSDLSRATAEEVLARLFTETPGKAEEGDASSKRKRRAPCQCAGHCNAPGHRAKGGCDSEVPAGTKYCEDCSCSSARCTRPKNKSDFCYAHRCVFERLPWPLRAARAARAVLPRLVPCDVVVFLQVYPMLRGHLAASLVAAALKEPTAVLAFANAWVAHTDKGPLAMFDAMQTALRASNGTPNKTELQQLTRQGAGRWLGVVAFCRALRLVQLQDAASASSRGEALVLGLRGASFCMQSTCPQELVGFVSACSKRQEEVDALGTAGAQVADLGQVLARIVEGVSDDTGLQWNRYTVAHLVRKLLLGWLTHSGAAGGIDWAEVPLRALPQTVLPDVKELMPAGFTPDCSAAEASDMMTGRPDQALLLSMWACLFGDVEAKWPQELDDILKFLRGPRCSVALQQFKTANKDVTPCPAVLLSGFFAE